MEISGNLGDQYMMYRYIDKYVCIYIYIRIYIYTQVRWLRFHDDFGTLLVGFVEICWLLILLMFSMSPFSQS